MGVNATAFVGSSFYGRLAPVMRPAKNGETPTRSGILRVIIHRPASWVQGCVRLIIRAACIGVASPPILAPSGVIAEGVERALVVTAFASSLLGVDRAFGSTKGLGIGRSCAAPSVVALTSLVVAAVVLGTGPPLGKACAKASFTVAVGKAFFASCTSYAFISLGATPRA